MTDRMRSKLNAVKLVSFLNSQSLGRIFSKRGEFQDGRQSWRILHHSSMQLAIVRRSISRLYVVSYLSSNDEQRKI